MRIRSSPNLYCICRQESTAVWVTAAIAPPGVRRPLLRMKHKSGDLPRTSCCLRCFRLEVQFCFRTGSFQGSFCVPILSVPPDRHGFFVPQKEEKNEKTHDPQPLLPAGPAALPGSAIYTPAAQDDQTQVSFTVTLATGKTTDYATLKVQDKDGKTMPCQEDEYATPPTTTCCPPVTTPTPPPTKAAARLPAAALPLLPARAVGSRYS